VHYQTEVLVSVMYGIWLFLLTVIICCHITKTKEWIDSISSRIKEAEAELRGLRTSCTVLCRRVNGIRRGLVGACEDANDDA